MPLRDPCARPTAAVVAAGLLLGLVQAAAAADRFPVPAVVIYPGDVIRDQMIVDHELPDFPGRTAVYTDRMAIVGKVAKRTLLPNQPIPANAVADPKVVTTGAMVRIVFKEGGLTISTYGSALAAGGIGDLIPVRNLESGLTVSGTIGADGSVHVGNG